MSLWDRLYRFIHRRRLREIAEMEAQIKQLQQLLETTEAIVETLMQNKG